MTATYEDAITAWAKAKFPHVPWLTGDVVTLRHVDATPDRGCDTCGYGSDNAHYLVELAGQRLARYETWQIPSLLAEIIAAVG